MSWRSYREKARIRPELLGLMVILATVFAFYVAASKHIPFLGGGHEIKIEFSSANQIAPDAPVRIAGVNVGKVKSIDAGPAHTAAVTVSLDDSAMPIHTDATARIRPRTFLEGAFFVDIQPGSPSAPDLRDGGTIPVGQTADPVQLDQILTTLQAPVREQLRATLFGFSKALTQPGPEAFRNTIPEFDPLFRKAAVVSDAFTGTEPHDLSGAIASSSKVAAALAADPPALGGVVRDFSKVAASLASRQRQLGQTISGLDQVFHQSPPTLDAVNAAVPNTDRLISAVRPLLRRSPAVIDPSVPLAGQTKKLLAPEELPALIADGTPAVRSLAGAAPNAIVSFAGLRDPTSCLLHNGLPTLKTPLDDGDLSTGQPNYRELLYGLTGLSSATRDFDGNGFATRYYAGFGDELLTTPFGSPEQHLFGMSDQPIYGSRPRKPSEPPPLRPDVPCTQDAPPNLHAETGPGGFSTDPSAQVRWEAPPGVPSARSVLSKLGDLTGGGK
jgi:phospholipid/cholesterol/gamma-HCH transport system substrate-binding protein